MMCAHYTTRYIDRSVRATSAAPIHSRSAYTNLLATHAQKADLETENKYTKGLEVRVI